MASADLIKDSSVNKSPTKALHLAAGIEQEQEEEEEELFEINLEAVNSIPPPQYYWESYVTATSNTLLANCLLPISDVSSAIPIVSKSSSDMLSAAERMANLIMVAESVKNFPGKFLWVPCNYTGTCGIG